MKKIIVTGLDDSINEIICSTVKKSIKNRKTDKVESSTFSHDLFENEDQQTYFILVYTPAEYLVNDFVGQDLNDQSELVESLEKWQPINAKILHFAYRNDDRCILVNSHSLTTDSGRKEFAAQIKDKFACKLSSLSKIDFNSGTQEEFYLAGKYLESNFQELFNLYMEIESVSHLSLENNFEEYEGSVYLNILNNLKNDNNLADEDVAQETEIQNLEFNTSDVVEGLSAYQVENQALKEEIKELNSLNNGLFQQVNLLQVSFEQAAIDIERANEEKKRLKDELLTSKKLIVKVRNQSEQKLAKLAKEIESLKTELLVNKPQTGGGELILDENKSLKDRVKNLTEENKLILIQLHQVQEKFEYYFDKAQAPIALTKKSKVLSVKNPLPTKSVKRRKLNKLKTKPVLFFTDAAKNAFSPSRKAG